MCVCVCVCVCVCTWTHALRAHKELSTVFSILVHGKYSENVYCFQQHDYYYCYSVTGAYICIGLHHLITKLLREGAILTQGPETKDVTEVQ